jgi:hypothetical protein
MEDFFAQYGTGQRKSLRRIGRDHVGKVAAPGGYPVRWTRDLELDSQNPLGFGVEKNEVPCLIANRHSNGKVCENSFQNIDLVENFSSGRRTGHEVFAFSQ